MQESTVQGMNVTPLIRDVNLIFFFIFPLQIFLKNVNPYSLNICKKVQKKKFKGIVWVRVHFSPGFPLGGGFPA
jgi:hypothetical protein